MLDCGQNKTQNALFHDLSSLNIDRVIVVCSIYILALAVFVSESQGPLSLAPVGRHHPTRLPIERLHIFAYRRHRERASKLVSNPTNSYVEGSLIY